METGRLKRDRVTFKVLISNDALNQSISLEDVVHYCIKY